MARPFLKICGLRRPGDLVYVLDRGARYAGLIVEVPGSPRSLSLTEAARLASYAAGHLVAVVRDLPESRLHDLVETIQPAAVQLHGQEPPERVAALHEVFPQVQIWRVLGIPSETPDPEATAEQLCRQAEQYGRAGAAAIVLDTRLASGSGGTGVCCDWRVARQVVRKVALPVILAGGLGPTNLAAAAREVAPAGLDVSSSVEKSPGVKSRELLEKLFAQWATLP